MFFSLLWITFIWYTLSCKGLTAHDDLNIEATRGWWSIRIPFNQSDCFVSLHILPLYFCSFLLIARWPIAERFRPHRKDFHQAPFWCSVLSDTRVFQHIARLSLTIDLHWKKVRTQTGSLKIITRAGFGPARRYEWISRFRHPKLREDKAYLFQCWKIIILAPNKHSFYIWSNLLSVQAFPRDCPYEISKSHFVRSFPDTAEFSSRSRLRERHLLPIFF